MDHWIILKIHSLFSLGYLPGIFDQRLLTAETNPWLTRPTRPERPVGPSPMCLGGTDGWRPKSIKRTVLPLENQWLEDEIA